MKVKKFIIFPLLAVLGGCSSGPETKEDVDSRLEERAERLTDSKEVHKEAANELLESAPGWYLKPPLKDDKGIYSASLGVSYNLTTALQKSRLMLKFQMASRLKSEVSAEETSIGNADSDYSIIVNNFINKVDVSNVEEISQDVKFINGKYHSFVLGVYPYSSIKADMLKANSKHGYRETTKAYTRLMERIKPTKEEGVNVEAAKPIAVE